MIHPTTAQPLPDNTFVMLQRQGDFTIASLFSRDRCNLLANGVAKKHPCDKEDRNIGVELAVERAVQNWRCGIIW